MNGRITILLCTFSLSLVSMESTWNGTEYLAASKPQFDNAIEYLSKITIKPNEHILDVGCGSGKITAEIGRRISAGHIVGIDSSPSMIATAQKEFASINTTFQVMKAEEIIFEECFDQIVSFATFHWIKDQKTAFQKCAQALKRGGILHISTSGGDEFKEPSKVAFYKTLQLDKWKEKLKNVDLKSYLYPLSTAQAKELLTLAHLEIKGMNVEPQKRVLSDKKSFKAFVSAFARGAYQFLHSLSAQEQDELLEDFTAHYLELVPAHQDGSIDYLVTTLTLVAQK